MDETDARGGRPARREWPIRTASPRSFGRRATASTGGTDNACEQRMLFTGAKAAGRLSSRGAACPVNGSSATVRKALMPDPNLQAVPCRQPRNFYLYAFRINAMLAKLDPICNNSHHGR